MQRLISLFRRDYESLGLAPEPDEPRPEVIDEPREPEYFEQLLEYLRERKQRQDVEIGAEESEPEMVLC